MAKTTNTANSGKPATGGASKADAKPPSKLPSKPSGKTLVTARTVVKPRTDKANKAATASKPKATKPKARKPPTKPKAGTKPAAKPKAASKPAPRTVADLLAHVERIDARLSRSGATTRRQVRALDKALAALDAREDDTGPSNALLARRIKSLKSQLASLALETRVAVRDDLKAALDADTPRRMAEVLFKVDMKMEAQGREQARAVARLNTHLADMARAVDARIASVETAQVTETEARRTADDRLEGRVDAVEAQTARALTDIGDRMVGLASRLRDDMDSVRDSVAVASSDSPGAEIADTIAQTRSELSGEITGAVAELGQSVEARLARAVRSATDADTRATELERAQGALVSELTARIEGLEYQLATVAAAPSQARAPEPSAVMDLSAYAAPQAASQAMPEAALPTAFQPSPVPSSVPAAFASDPVPMPMTTFEAAFDTPGSAAVAVPQSSEPVPAFNMAAPTPSPLVRDPDLPEHFPMEFVPAPITPQPTVQTIAPTVPQPAVFDTPARPDFAAPVPQPVLSDSDASLGELPYADPGYAEGTGLSRPGGDADASAKPRLSARNLRVGALAAGVAVVGAFAISQVMGGGDMGGGDRPANTAGAQQTFPTASASTATLPPPPPGMGAPESARVAFTQPRGELAEMTMPVLDAGEAGFDTLEAAVRAGNPVAQYQMGLVRFEDRDIAGSLALVRAAADSGLAPAQYRLAKFHEAGQGVPQDLGRAFTLTELAARQGHRVAMHDTAVFYAQGVDGRLPDHAQSLQWFEKAARLGVLDSQFNMAHLLHTGQELGIKQDLQTAYVWYAVAASNGDQEASARMDQLRARFTPEQLSAAEARIAAFQVQPLDEAANGIFRDLPWKAPASAPSGDKTASTGREQVRRVQSLLNDLGYDTGTPDGIAGAKTREAIVEFQRANDLAETGSASSTVLQELERVAGV